jgi:hypothetical protein
MLNKKKYWENRKAGLRGQGAHPYQEQRQLQERMAAGAKAKSKIDKPKGNKGNQASKLRSEV